jgi:hypothetical protein
MHGHSTSMYKKGIIDYDHSTMFGFVVHFCLRTAWNLWVHVFHICLRAQRTGSLSFFMWSRKCVYMNMRNIYFLSVLQTIRIHIWISNRDSQLGSIFPIQTQIVPVEEIVEDKHRIGNGTRFMNAKYTLKVTEGVSDYIITRITIFLLVISWHWQN